MSPVLLAAACAAALFLAALAPQAAAEGEDQGGLLGFLRGLFGMEAAPKTGADDSAGQGVLEQVQQALEAPPKDAYDYAVVARDIDLGHAQRIVGEAAMTWTEINPGMSFTLVEDGGPPTDVVFRFEPTYDVNMAGEWEQSYHDGPYIIRIKPALYDCEGSAHQLTDETMLNTAQWGIGASLGLANHTSEYHLMYGNDGQIPYDNRGYKIPAAPSVYEAVGESELLAEYDGLAEEFDAIYGETNLVMFNVSGTTYEEVAAEYDGTYADRLKEYGEVEDLLGSIDRQLGAIDRDLEALYAQYRHGNPPAHLENPLIDEYNRMADEYNAHADRMDRLVRTLESIEVRLDAELDAEEAELEAINDEMGRIRAELDCMYDESDFPVIQAIPAHEMREPTKAVRADPPVITTAILLDSEPAHTDLGQTDLPPVRPGIAAGSVATGGFDYGAMEREADYPEYDGVVVYVEGKVFDVFKYGNGDIKAATFVPSDALGQIIAAKMPWLDADVEGLWEHSKIAVRGTISDPAVFLRGALSPFDTRTVVDSATLMPLIEVSAVSLAGGAAIWEGGQPGPWAPAYEDAGDFAASHSGGSGSTLHSHAEEHLEEQAQFLSARFVLPHEIMLRLEECGEAAPARYSAEEMAVISCYEWLDAEYASFSGSEFDSPEAGPGIRGDARDYYSADDTRNAVIMSRADFALYRAAAGALMGAYGLDGRGLLQGEDGLAAYIVSSGTRGVGGQLSLESGIFTVLVAGDRERADALECYRTGFDLEQGRKVRYLYDGYAGPGHAECTAEYRGANAAWAAALSGIERPEWLAPDRYAPGGIKVPIGTKYCWQGCGDAGLEIGYGVGKNEVQTK